MSAESQALNHSGPPPSKPFQPSNRALAIVITVFAAIFMFWAFNPPLPPPNNPKLVPVVPTRIDVNGTNWDVKIVAFDGADRSLQGYTFCDIRVIEIRKTSDNVREDLIHELTHAMVCTDAGFGFQVNNLWFNSTTNADHQGIYRFASLWAELLRRNPSLVEYLGSHD